MCVSVSGLFMPTNRNGRRSRVGEYTEDLYFAGTGVVNLPVSEVKDWQWDYAIADLDQPDCVFVPTTPDIECRCDLFHPPTSTHHNHTHTHVPFVV